MHPAGAAYANDSSRSYEQVYRDQADEELRYVEMTGARLCEIYQQLLVLKGRS